MGLFVAENGHYQGWLATLLCCCAALTEDEYPVAMSKIVSSTASNGTGVCNEQPAPYTALPCMPPPTYMSFDQRPLPASKAGGTTEHADDSRPSTAPQPLEQWLNDQRPQQHSRQQSSITYGKGPSISRSSSFRRLEYSDGQRANLVPLKLAPVVLQPPMDDSQTTKKRAHKRTTSVGENLNDFKQELLWASQQSLPRMCSNPSARGGKLASTERQQSQSTVSLQDSQEDRPSVYRRSSPSFLPRPLLGSAPVPSRPRHSFDRKSLRRKSSHHSLRLAHADLTDIDKEILELNSIVEERRAEASKAKSPDHIAAVAPTMMVHARSETLNDIGSAFARPYTPRETRESRDHVRAVLDTPEGVSTTDRVNARPGPNSRVSGWLSGLMSNNSSSSNQAWSQEPFLKCQPASHDRVASQVSPAASVTDLECQSTTASSSPTSKGHHSRTATTESRMTHETPPSTVYSLDVSPRKQEEEFWPIPRAPISAGQVGLAF